MNSVFVKLWSDEAGVILSAELVIILTIAVLGMVVGLSNLQHALTAEFTDLRGAFQSLNQSYCTPSYRGCWKLWGGRGPISWVAGSCFYDCYDGCVGDWTSGGNACEIYGSSNFGLSSNACPTGACATGSDASVPSPSATLNPGFSPVPDPASSVPAQPTQ